ncbi:MAG: VTT domain-containing protein [Anaerolineae bacterium]
MTERRASFNLAAAWRKYRTRIVALCASLAITALILIYRREIANLSHLGYLGVLLVSIIGNATVILPVPSLAVVFAGGGVLNPILVGLVAGVGEPIGELTGYLAGYGGSAVIENRATFEKLKGWLERRGFITLFALSVIPNPLFDLAGISAGMLHYPVRKFLLACWLGKTIKALAIAFLGSISVGWLDKLLG